MVINVFIKVVYISKVSIVLLGPFFRLSASKPNYLPLRFSQQQGNVLPCLPIFLQLSYLKAHVICMIVQN